MHAPHALARAQSPSACTVIPRTLMVLLRAPLMFRSRARARAVVMATTSCSSNFGKRSVLTEMSYDDVFQYKGAAIRTTIQEDEEHLQQVQAKCSRDTARR